jgi:dGTPase
MSDSSYRDFDRERFFTEERRDPQHRSEFARDRARVLHSSALRRLGAKTQVLSPSGGDFARTRLTHSLEVAQIGREMAAELGLDPDLVDMACLAHDLGHPPFGHNGERALNDWMTGFGGFEGNAQTLRLLTRIEPKVFSPGGQSFGLNLTRASLDASCKYPWGLNQAKAESGATKSVKFGVYEDDMPVFEWLREQAPAKQKCVEAQVMDFADDVAYSVHDFEDAIVSNFVDPRVLAKDSSELILKISEWAGGAFSVLEIESALSRLRSNPNWPIQFGSSARELATLKNLTSSLIGAFVRRTTAETLAHFSGSSVSRYQAKVEVPRDVLAEIAVLKGIVSAFLMTTESRRPFYEWQRAILIELADALLALNGRELDAYSTEAWSVAADESAQRRVIVDQVASLTEQSAITWHRDFVTNGA